MPRKDPLPSGRSRRAPNASNRWSRRDARPLPSPDCAHALALDPLDSPPILLVEEDEFGRNTLARILRVDGHCVRAYRSLSEAQNYLEETTPGLILVGLLAPGPEWTAFFQWLRRRPRFRDIPIIVVSAQSGSVGRGVTHFAKPIDVDALRAAVRERLAR